MGNDYNLSGNLQKKRPWGLRIACIFSLVYNGTLLAITIASMFYADYVFNLLSRMFDAENFVPATAWLIMTGVGFLFIITIAAVLMIWNLNIHGFYLYIFTKAILMVLLFSYDYLNYFNTGFTIFMLLVFWSYRKRLQNTPEPLDN